MTGIAPLIRELGAFFDREPMPELTTITGPQSPTRGRWPPEVWAEMQRIYEAPDPFEVETGPAAIALARGEG